MAALAWTSSRLPLTAFLPIAAGRAERPEVVVVAVDGDDGTAAGLVERVGGDCSLLQAGHGCWVRLSSTVYWIPVSGAFPAGREVRGSCDRLYYCEWALQDLNL